MALRLRRGDHLLVVRRGALLRDSERGGIEIDVAPSQPGQLASAHAGVQRKGLQSDEAIVRQRVEELAGL